MRQIDSLDTIYKSIYNIARRNNIQGEINGEHSD